jgi:hypothetical protein
VQGQPQVGTTAGCTAAAATGGAAQIGATAGQAIAAAMHGTHVGPFQWHKPSVPRAQ